MTTPRRLNRAERRLGLKCWCGARAEIQEDQKIRSADGTTTIQTVSVCQAHSQMSQPA